MKKEFHLSLKFYQKIILFGFLFGFSTFSYSQPNDPIFVRLYIWVLQDDNGNGGVTEAMVNGSVDVLNGFFNPEGIYFVRECVTEYINNESYWVQGNEVICNIVDDFPPHSDGLNIYITCDACTAGGTSGGILSNNLVIGGTAELGTIWSRSVVIAHEVGHCFGLWHTEHGTVPEYSTDCLGNNTSDPDQCEEFVFGDITNREKCGDEISDTPASPFITTSSVSFLTCEWGAPGNNL